MFSAKVWDFVTAFVNSLSILIMKDLILLIYYVHILRSAQICLFSVIFWLGEYLDQEILTAKVSNLYTVCFNKLPQTLVENLFFSSLDSRGHKTLLKNVPILLYSHFNATTHKNVEFYSIDFVHCIEFIFKQ